jgi:hypothetical protein
VKEEVARIELKIDGFISAFEQRIEEKFRELGERLEKEITTITIRVLESSLANRTKRVSNDPK